MSLREWCTRWSAPPPTKPINQTATLLHSQEEAVFADAGYTGADKRPELEDCDVSWHIAVKRGIIKALPKALRDWAEAVESTLSQVRAWVEHPFHIVRTCSGTSGCAIAAWPRTPRNCAPCSPWPTW